MPVPDSGLSFQFHSDPSWDCTQRPASSPGSGYALLIVMMMAVILLISLAAALPSVYTEAQREKEQELIFRGTQYARAIYYFHQQFHRYPTSVKELLRTNDLSFLRRPYPDPMSRDGKWRFIHAAANGAILDSKSITLHPTPKPEKAQGQPNPGFAESQPKPEEGNQENPPDSNSSGETRKLLGAYIVGVASSSHRESIRVYNNHTHYDKWEFLGIPGVPGSVLQTPVLIPGLGSQQPSQPQQPTPQGPMTPTMGPPTNPAMPQ